MKVTDKKFLNVHQTIGPLTAGTVTSASKTSVLTGGIGNNNNNNAEAEASKADKLLVSHLSPVFWTQVQIRQKLFWFLNWR